MIKYKESSEPKSCWNRARPLEPVFVLLGRDQAAAHAIRAWCAARIVYGKNHGSDSQIIEALAMADKMEEFATAYRSVNTLAQHREHCEECKQAGLQSLCPIGALIFEKETAAREQ